MWAGVSLDMATKQSPQSRGHSPFLSTDAQGEGRPSPREYGHLLCPLPALTSLGPMSQDPLPEAAGPGWSRAFVGVVPPAV